MDASHKAIREHYRLDNQQFYSMKRTFNPSSPEFKKEECNFIAAIQVKKLNTETKVKKFKLNLDQSSRSQKKLIHARSQTTLQPEEVMKQVHSPTLSTHQHINLYQVNASSICLSPLKQASSPIVNASAASGNFHFDVSYQKNQLKKPKTSQKKNEELLHQISQGSRAMLILPQYGAQSQKSIRKISKPNQMFEMLKQVIPNADRDAPSSRQEAIAFLNWFETYEEQFRNITQQNEKDFKQFFSITFNEMIRQVQSEISQRGDILRKFNTLIELYHEYLVSKQYHKILLQQEVKLQEVEKSKQDYERILKKKADELDHIHYMQQELNEQLKKIQDNDRGQMHIKLEQQKQIANLQMAVKFLQRKLKEETDTKNYLQTKIQNILNKYQLQGQDTIQTDSEEEKEEKEENLLPGNQFIEAQVVENLNQVKFNPDKELNQAHVGTQTIMLMRSNRETQTETQNEALSPLKPIELLSPKRYSFHSESKTSQPEQMGLSPIITKRQQLQQGDAGRKTSITSVTQISWLKRALKQVINQEHNSNQTQQEQSEKLPSHREQIVRKFIENKAKSETDLGKYLVQETNEYHAQIVSEFTNSDKQKVIKFIKLYDENKDKNFLILVQHVYQDLELQDQYQQLQLNLNTQSQQIEELKAKLEKSPESPEKKQITIIRENENEEQQDQQNQFISRPISKRKKTFDGICGAEIVQAMRTKSFTRFKNFLSQQQVLKLIYLIYMDRIKMMKEVQLNNISREWELSNFTYTYMMKQYGIKRLVDQKFIIFILSVRKYISLLRINIFAKFLNLLDNQFNYSADEFNKYVEVLDFVLNKSTFGNSITGNEFEQKFYIPYIRALQYMGNFIDTRMTQEENFEFKKEVEQLKEADPKNKAGIIDFDQFMTKMLTKYRLIVNRAKAYVIHAFAACDLDGNKVCNMEEFLLLNRHIESASYDYKNVCKMFLENTDVLQDGEQCLSFDKFSIVCVENNLFTEQAQDNFLGIRHKREVEHKYKNLEDEWPELYLQYKYKFQNFVGLNSDDREKWLQIIEVLNDRVRKGNETSSINEQTKYNDQKPILIAFKILVEEAKFIEQDSQKKILQKQRTLVVDNNHQDDELLSLLDITDITEL